MVKPALVNLSQARFYFGGDTGLAHLAEAVGTPAYVLYGPTTPEMGFGPWRKQSFVFGADLWCRPCRGEGHYCFRISKKYLCQTKLTSQSVLEELKRLDTCTSRRFR
jgi:ADP-heptose:LPS heptosyltransferase